MAKKPESHAAHAHSHGDPVVWDPEATRARRGKWLLRVGALLAVVGAALWWYGRDRTPKTPRVVDVEQELKRANQLIVAKRAGEAEVILRELVEEQKGEPNALMSLATALYEQGKFLDALAVAKSALLTAPNDARVHCEVAVCQLALEHPMDALESVDKALANDPSSAQAYFVRSRALLALGKNDEAVAPLVRASTLAPNEASYVTQLAQQYIALGRLQEARAQTEKLASLLPERWEPLADLHRICLQLGDEAGAQSALSRAVALAPQASDVVKLKLEFEQRARK